MGSEESGAGRSVWARAKADGWAQVLARTGPALQRRVRDRFAAQKMGALGFRAGRTPRLLGLSHMTIGADFHAGDQLWLEAVVFYQGEHFSPRLTVGPHARLSDGVHIACLREITIGAHLLCGSRVLISDHTHGRYDAGTEASSPSSPPAERVLYSADAVRIGDSVWLGDGVAVLAGARVGDGCVIGAGSVVTGEVPPRTLAVGAPARVVRRWGGEGAGWVPVR